MKEVTNLQYKENYTSLKKEISEDLEDAHGLAESIFMKIATLLKATCMFNAISIKIPITVLTKIEKSVLQFTWKPKDSLITLAYSLSP
jgi:hypothetical protein